MSELDHAIRETSTIEPKLRRDVRTHYQEHRGKPSYILEDRANGRFYQIGLPEHQFLQCLNGHHTVGEAVARNAATQGENALTEQQAHQLIRWLVDHGLLDSSSVDQAERRMDHWRVQEAKKGNLLSKVLFFKVPLGCPDRLFAKLVPWVGWIFSRFGLVLWLGLMGWAALLLGQNGERFRDATTGIITPANWLGLGGVYLVLKVIHEMGHGVATRKFGGVVPEWGVQILMFVTPLTYADASSSWRFPSRWNRIAVSAAGMYVELAVAAVCLIFWTRTEPGLLNTALHHAVFAASMVTILFNANPLMRFDGYYILVDLLGIPNLGSRGQQFMAWLAKRVFLGMTDVPFPPAVRKHPVAVPIYGVLALLWRGVIILGIATLLSVLFKGAGIVLAATMVGGILLRFLFSTLKILFRGEAGMRPRPVRMALHWTLITLVAVGVLWGIHVDPAKRAPVVVEFAEKVEIRADCSGEIVEVLVQPGQWVEPGELLVRISNLDEETSREQVRLLHRASQVRAQVYLLESDLASYQAELENQAGLRKQLVQLDQLLASLELRAPFAGMVVGRGLESLPGRWISTGDPILSITPSQTKRLLVSVRQRDENYVREMLRSDEIRCLLRGWDEEIEARIDRIEFRATRALPHPALSLANGGPLSVRRQVDPLSLREKELALGGGNYDAELDHFSQLDSQAPRPELVKTRFAVWATLGEEESLRLREGEWGYARFTGIERVRLGPWLGDRTINYVRDRLEMAKSGAGMF